MKESLGVDVGGVIIDKVNDKTDTSFFGDNYLNTTAVPNVFEVLSRLVKERFGHNVHIISKCGQKVQDKTLNWLKHHDVYIRTGISPDRVHFCRERQAKAPICEELGITHFIDDKFEVLSYLTSVPNKYAFIPQGHEMQRYAYFIPYVHVVYSWKEVEKLLL